MDSIQDSAAALLVTLLGVFLERHAMRLTGEAETASDQIGD
jgi:hypothetical protein